jgi:Domain of unknown function (DUF6438)
MKKYFLILIFIGLASCKKDGFVKAQHIPSKLDSLADAGIEGLVHAADTNYRFFKLKPFRDYQGSGSYGTDSVLMQAAKRYNLNKSIYRADFDNNGYDDVLALGDMHWCNDTAFCSAITFVLMNFGKDSINVFPLYNEAYVRSPEFPQIITSKGTIPLIVAHKFDFKRKDIPIQLIYKNGGFVELAKKETIHNIEKVQFAVGPCFGSCPMFQISIEKSGSATFLAEHYNFKDAFNGDADEGFYTATVNKKDLDNIMSLLNYINFESLKNDYGVTWTDDQDAKLIISYDGGKTKTIRDYGLSGSYGLRLLYKHLHDLRFNQHWKKAAQPDNFKIRVLPEPPPPPKQ